MNVLTLIQEVAAEIGIPSPTIALASTDPQVKQLVQLLNKEGRALSTRYAWQAIIREATFVTTAVESQGTIASIVGAGHEYRYILNDTIWNRTRIQPICGPQSPRNWQGLQALSFSGPWPEYRIRGNELLLIANTTSGEDCAFEYVDRMWCTNAAGTTYQRSAVADTDVFILDDELIQAGLQWRWRAAKKLDYTEDFLTYENLVADAMARDGTKPVLNLAGDPDRFTPIGFFGVMGAGSGGSGGGWSPPGWNP